MTRVAASPPRLREDSDLARLLRREVVDGGIAPAASAAVLWREGDGWQGVGAGTGTTDNSGRVPVDLETPFDLASVTKSFFAATVARTVREGTVDWSTTLNQLLPEVVNAEWDVAALLSHRAGLVAHLPLFEPLEIRRPVSRARLLVKACSPRPECRGLPPPSGFAPLYSDLGYLLLGAALEAQQRDALDEIVVAAVATPLGLSVGSARQWLRSSPSFLQRVAATETCGFRRSIRGVVHDENAWALSGHGTSGHAGLFGTAQDVAAFGAAVLDAQAGRRGDWLDAAQVEPLVRRRPGGTLRAGFDGVSDGASSAGTLASPEAFGHLGFTGTSLWCDPEAGRVVVLLTNRVHPSRDNIRIRVARPRIHDALWRWGQADRK